jgi:hypothetical protein
MSMFLHKEHAMTQRNMLFEQQCRFVKADMGSVMPSVAGG